MMWKEKYKINVDLIDDQHKELFGRLSNFIQVVQNEYSWDEKIEEVKETMAFMQEYVVFHFDDEERYMQEIDYPNFEPHKKIHEDFKATVNTYVEIFQKEGYTEDKIQELCAKLMTWLIMHVGKMDQQIGKYVKSKEGQA